MIGLAPGTKVFLACQPIDLRAGFNGLAAKVKQVTGQDPFGGSLFIFRGKRGQQTTFSIQFAHRQDRLSLAPAVRENVAGGVPPTGKGLAMHLHG
jgi:transposase